MLNKFIGKIINKINNGILDKWCRYHTPFFERMALLKRDFPDEEFVLRVEAFIPGRLQIISTSLPKGMFRSACIKKARHYGARAVFTGKYSAKLIF